MNDLNMGQFLGNLALVLWGLVAVGLLARVLHWTFRR